MFFIVFTVAPIISSAWRTPGLIFSNLSASSTILFIASNDFFDYEAKYEGKSDEITPAKISDELMNKLSQISKNVYNQIGLKGFSRSEFIVNDYGIYYLETNTVPGLTSESILPQQAKCAGITLEDLFSNAIKEVVK